jgi:ABC-type transport system involved in multi-copper enzyme maturation permease subunit
MSKKPFLGRLAFWLSFSGLLLTLLLLIYLFILAFPASQGLAKIIAPQSIYPYLKTISIIITTVSAGLVALGIIIGINALVKKQRKGALAGIILGGIWLLLVIALVVLGLVVFSAFKGEKKLPKTEYEKWEKCRHNQQQLELIINEFWKKDHPNASKEDIMKLNLGPDGDLVGFKTPEGQIIYYTGDMSIFDCPGDGNDKDPQDKDIDYAVDYVDKEGKAHVKCIDPEGVKAGHNQATMEKETEE